MEELSEFLGVLAHDREILGSLWALLFAALTAGIFKYVLPPIERRWPALGPDPSGGLPKLRIGAVAVLLVLFLYVSTR